MNMDTFWWTQISGPSRYMQDAIDSLADCRVLLLEETPYMDAFLQIMQERLRIYDSSLHIETSFAREWECEEIGQTLLRKYAPAAGYHPMDGSKMMFVAKQDLLLHRVLIIRCADRGNRWLDEVVEYARHATPRNGIVILTYIGNCPLEQKRRGVAIPKFKSFVTPYDMQLFANCCLSKLSGLSLHLRQYIAHVAARLSGTNSELCHALAEESLASDPHGLLEQMVSVYPEAGALVADKKTVNSVIWEAQIQIAFPIIEKERRRWIEQYYSQLAALLPQKDEFNKSIDKPEDMELRHLRYYFFVPYANTIPLADRQNFRLFYDSRNDLAHLEPLESEVLLQILNYRENHQEVN